MSNRLAILCSGQAGQHAGMFDLAKEDLAVDALLQSWPLEAVCKYPLSEILSNDKLLYANLIAQPVVVASSLATWEAVRKLLPTPVIVAGYSIGELSSWAVAGALSVEEAIHLAARRAQLLQACVVNDQPQLMMAISLSHALSTISDLRDILHIHGFHIAIEVDEDSVIVGGLVECADAVETAVTKLGGKVNRLPIEIASHTSWMSKAVTPFKQALIDSQIQDPKFPVLAGINGTRQHTREDACSSLPSQLAETIRWNAVMDSVNEAGVTMALEIGPGGALAKMLKSRHQHIESRSVADFRSLSGLQKWIERCEQT
tara:strand:+ start:7535 stop:8482 length:948 start_codon:yes stop_codon:yes gene_type:complete